MSRAQVTRLEHVVTIALLSGVALAGAVVIVRQTDVTGFFMSFLACVAIIPWLWMLGSLGLVGRAHGRLVERDSKRFRRRFMREKT